MKGPDRDFSFYIMDIKQFLDSTYLKTAEQAGISEAENRDIAKHLIEQAISEQFKLVMIRPEYVTLAKQIIFKENCAVRIGTVIDFPNGTSAVSEKLTEAREAIENGADDLDFVINYQAYKNGEIERVKNEVLQGTKLGITHLKTVKWIIETAALSGQEIIRISALIKNVVLSNFDDDQLANVFVKSSTGFYKTSDNKPNGATIQDITLMLENAAPLSVKASGGIRNYQEAIEMINLGVKRLGTSSAMEIAHGGTASQNY